MMPHPNHSPATRHGFREGQSPANKGKKYPPETLTGSEVRQLLMQCSSRTFSGARNRALLTVLYRAGLRLNEALDLKPKDVDATLGTVRVLHGKNDRARTTAMDPEAFSVLERWQDRRRAGTGITNFEHLFCTRYGTKLHSSYVRQLLPRLAARAGIAKRVHPHGLRHTFAAELAREGVPVNLIQAALGHSNVGTTSKYLAHICPQQVIDMARSRTWEGAPKGRVRP